MTETTAHDAFNDEETSNAAFDLDVVVEHEAEMAAPAVTSKFFCTPGCGKTGSFNSYCC